MKAITEAIRAAEIRVKGIQAVGITNQREPVVMRDRKVCLPLSPPRP